MKRTYEDLSDDEKQVYLLSRGLAVDLPYAICLIPFMVILLVTSNKYIGVGAFFICVVFFIGYFIDLKRLRKAHRID